jgi:glycosyltransferase involved in cell wall biosynthesis
MNRVGLCMIVKNESHVIARCLDSVRGFVDHVLIEDTGSTDGTQKIIQDWLRENNLPGAVIQEPWRDFAYNRTHVMEALRRVEAIDYALVIDADDALVMDEGFDPVAFKREMRHDFYDVQIRHGDSRFLRPQLCSNHKPFCYKAVLHEYLEAPPDTSRADAKGFHIQTGRGGARNQNPRKYQDDAAALEKALLTETDPFLVSRYTFYLAQSYRDCNEREKALKNYLRRAELGYWGEEIYFSRYQAAKLMEELKHPPEETIAAYLKACESSPGRAEALHGAARYCRSLGRNEEGFQYAKRGAEKTIPPAALFTESWIYDYGLLDEVGINGYWSGHYRDSLDACLRLLAGTKLPPDQRGRIVKNAQFSLEKLPADPNPAKFRPAGLAPGQHAPQPPRPSHSKLPDPAPKILLAILAKQKQATLPLYLRCIEALDYPKSSIVLYIRTNNNTDRTEAILEEWVQRVRGQYAAVEWDAADVGERVQDFDVHEWNATRFSVLGKIRQTSLEKTLQHGCDFYFTADVDNFIRPFTLRELVALNLPIVSPLLRHSDARSLYSNYHADIDGSGYFRGCDQYGMIISQSIVGVFELPVVHCTYLIRASCLPSLSYNDASKRHEYVVFSESARKAGVPQYFDNRQVYGYLTLTEEPEAADKLLAAELAERSPPAKAAGAPNIFACIGLHGSGSTWMFNLVREVAASRGIEFVSLHRDSEANLPRDLFGRKLIIGKTHNPFPSYQTFIAESGEPAVITVRDPRDAVASHMKRFSVGFEEALKTVARSAETLVSMSKLRALSVFRYEDGFVGKNETLEAVAGLLGVTLSEEQRRAILARLTPEAVKGKIGALEAAGVIQGERVWDKETHWHANHVGDGKVGKFKDALSEAQQKEVVERTREYCEMFGYSMAVEMGAPRAPEPLRALAG